MAALEPLDDARGAGAGTGAGPGTGTISAEHWKVLSLSTLGGALEFYEFVVFLHMSPVISQLFSASDVAPWLAQLQVLGIYAVGYLVRPLGGTVLAALGDRIGRKRLFGITLLLMALGTLGIGVLPTYAQIGAAAPVLLLICRTGQGLAMGGEFPAAASYVMETVPENRISLAIGLLTVGFGLGSLLAVGMILLLSSHLPQADYLAWGWRVPFLAGGLFGLLSVHLRRSVKESPVFVQMARAAQSAQRLPFSALFTRYRRELLVATGLALVSGGLIQAVQLYPVAYFQVEMQWPRALMSSAQMGLTASAMVFTVLTTAAADRFGSTRVITVFAVLNIIGTVWFYAQVTPSTVFWGWSALGALNAGLVPVVLAPMARVFPAPLRITGIAASYNLAQAIAGGALPVLMGSLSHHWPSTMWGVPAALCLAAIVCAPMAQRLQKPVAPT
ncbi:MFS transporter [Curvibacter gracilis]|uniref:MFS transporter n=1 Tax=Curvibacter gracilis TaxID=230310 RepID=UPI0004B026A8|nr:MFS transporter [Curvibacter gracilis]